MVLKLYQAVGSIAKLVSGNLWITIASFRHNQTAENVSKLVFVASESESEWSNQWQLKLQF
jgi:hypothetical protein